MDENNHHINYTAADIEKYWKGQLSAAEQHNMEKAALDDPFLADAIEGYEEKASMLPPVITADNNELKKRLAERIAEKQSAPVIKFAWWKVAAALIVFIGAGWLYTAVNNKATVETIAKNDEVKKESPVITKTDTAVIIPDTVANTLALRDVAINKRAKTSPKNYTPASKAREPAAAAPVVSAAQPPPAARQAETEKTANEIAGSKDALAKQTVKKKEAGKLIDAEAREQKAQSFAIEDDKASNAVAGKGSNFSNTFNGNITDQQHKPVANAFIQIPNLNVATQTDTRGYFSFNAADTALNVSLAADGFETQHIHLQNKAVLNQIVLTPVQNNNLNEVVTQSNGAERRKEAITNDISITIPDAEPVAGWVAYNQYLQKNKKTTDDTKDIHGNVVVSFDVRNKWLTNFKITKPLDDDLDAEAIRLIKEGPAWKLLKGKKATATVIVKF